MNCRSQGALEYLLLIGGAVVVAAVVTVGVLSIGSSSSSVTEKNAIAVEKQKQQAQFGFSVPGGVAVGGLVSYWPFDEGASASVFADKRGVMNLYRFGDTFTVAGKTGNGIQIGPAVSAGCSSSPSGGAHSHSTMGGSGNLQGQITNLPQGSYSISWWNYETGSGATRINTATDVLWATCGNCSNWILRNEIRKRSTTGDTSASFSYTAPSVGSWHHFVHYFDKPNNKTGLYIDGQQVVEKIFPAGLDFGTVIWFSVGVYRPDCTDAIPAAIYDDVMIFNRILTPAEVQRIYIDS